MPIDVSMYNQGQNSQNPLENATRMLGLQSAINQNKLFPGQLLQQQQQLQQGKQAIEQGQIGIDQSRMAYMNKQYDVLNGELGGLASQPNLTKEDVFRAGQRLIDAKVITPEMFIASVKNMPDDPSKLPGYMEQLLTTTLSAQEKANMAFGSPQNINVGQGIRTIAVSPTKGVKQIAQDIDVFPSRSELNQRMPLGVDQRGRRIEGTQKQFLERATGIDPATGEPVEPPPQQMAGLPKSVKAANQQVPGGGIVAEMAPGEAETMQDSAKAWQSARQYVAGDNNTPNGSAQRLLTLNSALKGLQNTTRTGPGSQTVNDMKSFIMTIAPEAGKLVGITPEDIASYDEANKYLTAYASQAAGAMGSDSKLATALSGNASTHISNLAAQDVVKASIALEKAKMTQVALFQKYEGNPEEFSDWAAEMNRKIDPRAFAIDLMNAEKRKKMISTMPTDQKKRFFESVRLGIEAGVIDPQTLSSANGK